MGCWLESFGLIAGNKTWEKDKVRLSFYQVSTFLVNSQAKHYKFKDRMLSGIIEL